MMQVEVRCNGILVEVVDVTNTGVCVNREATEIIYKVKCGKRTREVMHRPSDGALKLAALALHAVTRRKPRTADYMALAAGRDAE